MLVISIITSLTTGVVLAPALRAVILKASKLPKQIRDAISTNDMLVLGDAQSGKTSLLWLMHHNKTYELKGGQRVSPSRTFGVDNVAVAILGSKKHDLKSFKERKQQAPNARAQVDVGGEWHEKWPELIAKIKPEGIVYLVRLPDAFEQNSAYKEAMLKLIRFVIAPCAAANFLNALHLFLTFADTLPSGEETARRHSAELNVEKALIAELARANNATLRARLDIKVRSIQLSPNANEWRDAIDGILSFGRAMKGRS